MLSNRPTGDLDIRLTHRGKSARLIQRNSQGGANFGDTYCFSDDGTASLSVGADQRYTTSSYLIPGASQNVTYKPQDAFSVFNGLAAGGKWTVSVSDTEVADTGTITSATLTASKCPDQGKLLDLG